MPKTFNQPKPVYAKEPDPRYEETHKRMERAYKRANYSYSADTYQEKRQDYTRRMNIDLQREYPDLTTETLISVQRVFLPYSRMFEFENGELDTNYKVKSAIVYKVLVEIESEHARKAGYHTIINVPNNAGQFTHVIGRYQRPIIEPTSFDRQGNVTNARIKNYHWTYFIEDTPANIKAIFKRYNQRPKQGCIVTIANLESNNHYAGSYALVDEDEFITADIRDIIEGNRLGLTARAYHEWEARKQKLIAGGKATKAQLDRITDMDFLKMLSDKDKRDNK